MYKKGSRNAAGQRRSALVERIRLREEWSELKGIPDESPVSRNIFSPRSTNISNVLKNKTASKAKASARAAPSTSDALRGVVALVSVAAEPRALALRAALAALGASVVPSWCPLVTHLVWAEGGCHATRAKARALASRLVSPLWVEACAAAGRRLSEQSFPAAVRASDLPSPRTLRRLLKRAEHDNLPLVDLMSESDTDTSAEASDTTTDTNDKSHDSRDVATCVNTAPRRALPASITPSPPKKSRRKLFSQKMIDEHPPSDSDDTASSSPSVILHVMTPEDRRKKMQRDRGLNKSIKSIIKSKRLATSQKHRLAPVTESSPRIVLTGMTTVEYITCYEIRALGCCIQGEVTKTTTHVVLGSSWECAATRTNEVPQPDATKPRTLNALLGAVRGCYILHAQWIRDCLEAKKLLNTRGYEVEYLKKTSEMARDERDMLEIIEPDFGLDLFGFKRVRLSTKVDNERAVIELLSLCGATVLIPTKSPARKLYSDMVASLKGSSPIKKSDKRTQKGRKNIYAFSKRGRITTSNWNQKGSQSRYVDRQLGSWWKMEMIADDAANYDFIIGTEKGQVSSKWVFDSIEEARAKSTKNYVNK